MYKIISKRPLNAAGTTIEMVVEAPLVARKCLPGQFIIFRVDEFGERVPLTIADYDREKGTVTIMIGVPKKVSLEDLFAQIQQGEIKDFNIIVKADVQGSAEAVKASLEKLTNDEVRVRVIHSAVGAISESDVMKKIIRS